MFVTSWLSYNHSLQIANNLLLAFKHYAKSQGINYVGKTQKFIWGNRFFLITFYRSPEDCGYFSALQNNVRLQYILCHIVETSNCRPKYEMYFSFDLYKMTFLELFDIDYHVASNYLKESQEKYINSIEAGLRGNLLI